MSDNDHNWAVQRLEQFALDVRFGRARVAFYNEPWCAGVESDGTIQLGKVRIRIQVEYDE